MIVVFALCVSVDRVCMYTHMGIGTHKQTHTKEPKQGDNSVKTLGFCSLIVLERKVCRGWKGNEGQ